MNNSLKSNTIEALNQRFEANKNVVFETDSNNDFVFCKLCHGNSQVSISLYGAHITQYRVDQKEVLWMSPDAKFETGKAIRGGIPICWPWFGPHASDPAKPNHGFARNQHWEIVSAEANESVATAKLELRDNEFTKQLFPFEFCLTLEIELSDFLRVCLTASNESYSTMEVGGALHSYFQVGDVSTITVNGLENVRYLDQLDGHAIKKDSDCIRFDKEIDRVYLDSNPEILIKEAGNKIVVGKSGSGTTVVWNPWIDKSRKMSDVPDDAYKSFVCVETANAFDDVREIEPGESHRINQAIRLERS